MDQAAPASDGQATPTALEGRQRSPYSQGLMQGAARETVFRHRHMLGIEGLSPEDIKHVLDLADGYVELNRQAEKKRALLRGRTIINCFFENSTRTRTSFEVAGKRLGGDVINMSVAASSMHKGETLIDTAMTLNAMHPDVLIVRHPESAQSSCFPRNWTAPSSMPATAATSTRPRRCSTR
jgi:aspartate carbamoyltransferase catalytic subunit